MRTLSILLLVGCRFPAGGADVQFVSDDPDRLVFAVLGDAGSGTEHQRRVGAAVTEVCAVAGCQLVLYLGDNIYESGVAGVDDPRWKTHFEDMYPDLDLPFYAVPGNHDYGWHGSSIPSAWQVQKVQHQIDYSAHSERWNMPARYYTLRERDGLATFYALDTTTLVWSGDTRQADWMARELDDSSALYTFAFGHHTIRSNGKHGNAGDYPASEGRSGALLDQVFRESLCGEVDLVMTGHDHNLQWISGSCPGTEVAVSGTAGKARPLLDPTEWNDQTLFPPAEEPALGEEAGFLIVEASRDATGLIGSFYDADGERLFSYDGGAIDG